MATFHKMKVTGPRCAEFITEPLQAMRELNPKLNSIIQSTEQMNKVVCEAAKQPLKKRRKIASSVVAVHDAHLQRLKALKADAEHTYDPLTRSLAQIPQQLVAAAAPDVAPPPLQMQEEEDESYLSSHTVMHRIAELVPHRYRNKVRSLENFLKPHQNLIRISPNGHPIIGGKEIRGANVIDIMRSLYVWRKDQPLPRGASEVIQALQSVGVPSGLLSTSSALAEYIRLLEKGVVATRAEEQEEEEEGEEEEQEEEEEGIPEKFETPLPPTHLPQPVKTIIERPSTSGAPVRVEAPKGSTIAKGSPSLIPKKTKQEVPSAIPTAAAKRPASQTASQSGQGYWHGRWLGPPLWTGFGQPKAPKPHLPGKPIHWLSLY